MICPALARWVADDVQRDASIRRELRNAREEATLAWDNKKKKSEG
jgi:hypothetical protein